MAKMKKMFANMKKMVANIVGLLIIIILVCGMPGLFYQMDHQVFIDPVPPNEKELEKMGFLKLPITKLDDVTVQAYVSKDSTCMITFTTNSHNRQRIYYVNSSEKCTYDLIGRGLNAFYCPCYGDYWMKAYWTTKEVKK